MNIREKHAILEELEALIKVFEEMKHNSNWLLTEKVSRYHDRSRQLIQEFVDEDFVKLKEKWNKTISDATASVLSEISNELQKTYLITV